MFCTTWMSSRGNLQFWIGNWVLLSLLSNFDVKKKQMAAEGVELTIRHNVRGYSSYQRSESLRGLGEPYLISPQDDFENPSQTVQCPNHTNFSDDDYTQERSIPKRIEAEKEISSWATRLFIGRSHSGERLCLDWHIQKLEGHWFLVTGHVESMDESDISEKKVFAFHSMKLEIFDSKITIVMLDERQYKE